MSSPPKIDAAYIQSVRASVARDSFRHFIEYVQPSYQFNWHHLVLIDALQRLAERKFSRLIVMMPPRHGKSELVSRLFPAWCFARNQNEQIILASYSSDLASAMNRDCQKIIGSPEFARLFPNVHLSEGRGDDAIKTAKRFDIVGAKGYYIAAGVGGGITGAGATIGIIDDPVKNSEEAESKTYRDKAWNWKTSTFDTRQEPGFVEVICQTRWHHDDLTGRTLQDAGPDTEIICFPALAEKDEGHRKQGEALWPTKYSREKLLSILKTVGTRVWNALFQQRPSDEEGGKIKRHWFSRYDARTYDYSKKVVNFFVDTAYTAEEENDPCAAIAYVKEGANFYVLECTAKHLDFPDQTKFVSDFAQRNGYGRRSVIRIEPKATGKSVVQSMKKETELNVLEAKAPKESKTGRVNSIAGMLEAGRVFLPDGMTWVEDFLSECAAFPNTAHDDRVDCLTGMVLNETGKSFGIHYG
jgi:predicted phage terminase large subunit-like protein